VSYSESHFWPWWDQKNVGSLMNKVMFLSVGSYLQYIGYNSEAGLLTSSLGSETVQTNHGIAIVKRSLFREPNLLQ
jgi:hypothetical protein